MRQRSSVLALLACTVLPTTAHAQGASPLPLERVRLYETGVGYFERTGSLGSENLSLPVPAGHLDDALKTLVVMSRDGSTSVGGIEFSSSVSRDMARALAGLPNGDDGSISHDKLLASMKGRNVEIRHAGATHKGRLVEVLPPPPEGHVECQEVTAAGGTATKACTTRHYSTLLLVTDNDDVRRFRSIDVDGVRALDGAWRARVDSALDALSDQGAQSARSLRVLAQGGKSLTLGYVAETPVWRSTYRLVLDEGKEHKDRLQGWALLHNDTDEDWKKVRVELVNGRPDSFLFPLAAPRYERRELVTPERELSTVPQLLGKTVDNMWSGEAGGIGLSGVGMGGGGSGYGMGLGSVGTSGHGAGMGQIGPAASSLLEVGNLAGLSKAEGIESAAMFQYSLDRPIDLRAHGSALLPFLNESVRSESVAYFSAPGEVARSAAHLFNNTRQTLPAGTIAVFGAGGFAGETALARTKPSETRILQFGYDLDIELDESSSTNSDEPRVMLFASNDVLEEHYVRHTLVTYHLKNKSGRPRKVYLELGYVSNARVEGADALTFDEVQQKPIAAFDAPAQSDKHRDLKIDEGLTRGYPFKELTARILRKLAAGKGVSVEQRRTLEKAADQLVAAIKLRNDKAAKAKDAARIEQNIERLRPSVQAMGDHAGDLRDRLLAAEDQLDALQKEIVALEVAERAKLRDAKQTLRGLKAK